MRERVSFSMLLRDMSQYTMPKRRDYTNGINQRPLELYLPAVRHTVARYKYIYTCYAAVVLGCEIRSSRMFFFFTSPAYSRFPPSAVLKATCRRSTFTSTAISIELLCLAVHGKAQIHVPDAVRGLPLSSRFPFCRCKRARRQRCDLLAYCIHFLSFFFSFIRKNRPPVLFFYITSETHPSLVRAILDSMRNIIIHIGL